MYFRVNFKRKKPTFCSLLTWIIFIELNFTVAFQLIRITLDDQFVGGVGGIGDPSNGGMILKWGGGQYPFTDYENLLKLCSQRHI